MCVGFSVVAQGSEDSHLVVDTNNTSTGYNTTTEDILSITCNCTTDVNTTLPIQYIQCQYSGLQDTGYSLEVLRFHGGIKQPVLMQTIWGQRILEFVGKGFENGVPYSLSTVTQEAWYKVLNTSGEEYCVKLRQGSAFVESAVCKRKAQGDEDSGLVVDTNNTSTGYNTTVEDKRKETKASGAGSWFDCFLVCGTVIGLVAIILVIGIIVWAVKYRRRKNTNYSAVNPVENIEMNNVS